MALPTPVSLTHLDNQNDDPRQAREQLFELGTKFNALLAALGNHVELDIGDGLVSEGGRLKVSIDPQDDVHIDEGTQT